GYYYTQYFFADAERCRVRLVSSNAYNDTDIGPISTIAGNSCGSDPGNASDALATSWTLGYPTGLSAPADASMIGKPAGTEGVLIADEGFKRVDLWSADGKITTVAGTGACGAAPADGVDIAANSAGLCDPVRVAAHPDDPNRFLILDAGSQGNPGHVYEVYYDG